MAWRHGGGRWHGGGTVVAGGTVTCCHEVPYVFVWCDRCMGVPGGLSYGTTLMRNARAWVYRGMVVWSGMCFVCQVRMCTKVWLDGVRGGWSYGGSLVRIVKCMVTWRQKCTVARSTGDVAL